MNVRRIEVGPVIVVLGAILLLVSLFLNWFEPGLNAWEVFEVLDLVLAALAIVSILAALGAAGVAAPPIDPRWLGVAAITALVLVLAALLDHPPAARGADIDIGLWLALAGAAVLAAGAVLSTARVRVSLDVQARRTRMTAVDARRRGADTEESPPPESKL